jgi:hypothetical protein
MTGDICAPSVRVRPKPVFARASNTCRLGSGAMEMKKADYLARSTKEHTDRKETQLNTKKHTSMKIEASSSRDRNMALASKLGIKDASQVPHACACICCVAIGQLGHALEISGSSPSDDTVVMVCYRDLFPAKANG